MVTLPGNKEDMPKVLESLASAREGYGKLQDIKKIIEIAGLQARVYNHLGNIRERDIVSKIFKNFIELKNKRERETFVNDDFKVNVKSLEKELERLIKNDVLIT